MATVTKDAYFRLTENRLYKFDETEVNYREGEGEDVCHTCIHFFQRVRDGFHTCEIFRNDYTDQKGVDPGYVCDFHTTDGKTFPLYTFKLTSKDKTSA